MMSHLPASMINGVDELVDIAETFQASRGVCVGDLLPDPVTSSN